MGLDLLFLRVPGRLKGLEHRIKRTRVLDIVSSQVLHRACDQAHEAAETRRCLCGKRQTALGQFIEQTPSGVRYIGKEAAIMLDQFFKGRLKALHCFLYRRQQAAILGNVEHHAAHHFHRHGGGLGGSLHGHGGIHHRGHTVSAPARQGHRQRPGLADCTAAGKPPYQPLELRHVFDGLCRGAAGKIAAAQPWLDAGSADPRVHPARLSRPRLHGHLLHRHAMGRHGAIDPRVKRIAARQHLAQYSHGQQRFFGCWGHDPLMGVAIPARTRPGTHPAAPVTGIAVVAHGSIHGGAVSRISAPIASPRAARAAVASAIPCATRATVTGARTTAPATIGPGWHAKHSVTHGLHTVLPQA